MHNTLKRRTNLLREKNHRDETNIKYSQSQHVYSQDFLEQYQTFPPIKHL